MNKRTKYTDVIYELACDQVSLWNTYPTRLIIPNKMIFVRMFSQLLFDAPAQYSGFASTAAISLKSANKQYVPVKDHFMSRKLGGLAIVNLIERSVVSSTPVTKLEISQIVQAYCQVHYITAQEHKLLRRHQQTCSPDVAYARSSIELVQCLTLFTPRKQYHQIVTPIELNKDVRDNLPSDPIKIIHNQQGYAR